MYRVTEVPACDFFAAFTLARQSDLEIAKHTVNLGPDQLMERYKCYLVRSGFADNGTRETHYAGFVIEQRGKRRLRCMFNATGPVTRTPRHKLGMFMVKEAIRLGARSLNCPADWREKMYRKAGFVETSRLVYMELPRGSVGTDEGEPDEG